MYWDLKPYQNICLWIFNNFKATVLRIGDPCGDINSTVQRVLFFVLKLSQPQWNKTF